MDAHSRNGRVWKIRSASAGNLRWIVLDPMLSIDSPGARAIRLGFSRTYANGVWNVAADLPNDFQEFVSGRAIGVLDDACAFGVTMRHACALVRDVGGKVNCVRSCVSSAQGKASILDANPDVEFATFVEGDFEAAHIRDGCPGLPHAGRRVADMTAITFPGGDVQVRIPPTAFSGGLWERMSADRALGWELRKARATLAKRLSEALGRPARVRDMTALGDTVPLLLSLGQRATSDTLLSDLLA